MNQLVRSPVQEPPAKLRRLGAARPGVFGVLDIGTT